MAQRFRYKLEILLTYRKLKRIEAAALWARARSALAKAEADLEEAHAGVRQWLEEQHQVERDAMEGDRLALQRVRYIEKALKNAEKRRATAASVVLDKKDATDQAASDFEAALNAERLLERHRDTLKMEFQKEMEARWAAELDEVASVMYLRRER